MTATYHNFPAVVDLAVVAASSDEEGRFRAPRGAPLADRARATAARIGRSNQDVRDAMWAALDAIAGLEKTIDGLQTTLALKERGVQLQPEMVLIGADGVELQRTGPWPNGQNVWVYLRLELRDVQNLLAVRGTLEQRDNGAFVAFRDLRGDERDLIVAFVFQQEAKERRRALDTPG